MRSLIHALGYADLAFLQPSRKIDVGQFDIRNQDGIRSAYELGLTEGDAFTTSLNETSARQV